MNAKKIGFIGLGLIGGSIAKAIRQYYPDYDIIAFDKNKESLTPMPSSASVRNFNIILKLALSVKLKEQFFQFLIGLYAVDFFA